MSVLDRFISKYKLPLTVFSALGLGAITARASTEVSGQVRSYGEGNPVANTKVKEEITHDSTFADTNGFYSLIFETNGGISEEESKTIKVYSNGQNLILEDNNGFELTISIYDILGRQMGKTIKERSETEGILSVSEFSQGLYLLNLKKGNEVIGRGNFVVLNGMPFALSINLIKERSNENNRNTSIRAKTQSSLTRGTEKDTLYFAFEDTTGAHYSKKHPLILTKGQDTIVSPLLIPTDTNKFDSDMAQTLVSRSKYVKNTKIHDTLSSHIVYLIDDFDMSDEMVDWAVKSHKSTTTHQAICDYFTKGIFNEDTHIDTITGHHALPYGPDTFLIMVDNTIPGNGTFKNVYDGEGYIVGGWVKVRGNATKKDVELESLGNCGYLKNINDKRRYFDPDDGPLEPTVMDSLMRFIYESPPAFWPDSIPPIE